jgi:hypothetical protein
MTSSLGLGSLQVTEEIPDLAPNEVADGKECRRVLLLIPLAKT